MTVSDNEYINARKSGEQIYSAIGNVFSPVLNAPVSFSAEGFNHLVYKRANAERERESQIARFKIIHTAHQLVKISTTYQEYEEVIKEFEIKRFKKRTKKSGIVRYWGIIAIIDETKIKVIIRKVENGSLHFWSVIPTWNTNIFRDVKFRSYMKGHPEED